MAAELQRDLAGAAAVVMFSWPANGRPTDYVMDLADVEWSMPFLADFLNALGDRLGRENVHLVAHSLGSRGVIQALERLRADQGEQAVMGRLVLLAPDFDSQTFIERLPRLAPMVARITLYASSNDTPLKASRQLSGYPRLGEAGEFLTVVAGVETIDVSPVGRYQILGHEYFHYHPLVSADLVRLLTRGEPAAQRPGLRAKAQGGMQYWEITPPREP
jgi:esterase/lipase superfamily enzyme